MFVVVAWQDHKQHTVEMSRQVCREAARQNHSNTPWNLNNDNGLGVFLVTDFLKKRNRTKPLETQAMNRVMPRSGKTRHLFHPWRNKTERCRNHSNEVTRRLKYDTKHDQTFMLWQGYAAKRRDQTTSFLLYFDLITSRNHNRALSSHSHNRTRPWFVP